MKWTSKKREGEKKGEIMLSNESFWEQEWKKERKADDTKDIIKLWAETDVNKRRKKKGYNCSDQQRKERK